MDQCVRVCLILKREHFLVFVFSAQRRIRSDLDWKQQAQLGKQVKNNQAAVQGEESFMVLEITSEQSLFLNDLLFFYFILLRTDV